MEPPPVAASLPPQLPPQEEASDNPAPSLFDYNIKGKAVTLYGLTLKSFLEFRSQEPHPFKQNFESILTQLAKGRELVALFTIFRNSLKGIVIHIKGVGPKGYFPTTETRIRDVEQELLTWKENIEQALNDASRLSGIFCNVVSKWQTPENFRSKPSVTSRCVHVFYQHVGKEKRRTTHLQNRTENLLKELAKIRAEIDLIHEDIKNHFRVCSPVFFKQNCFNKPVDLERKSLLRQNLTTQLQAMNEQMTQAHLYFKKLKEHLEKWIKWCGQAEEHEALSDEDKNKLGTDYDKLLNEYHNLEKGYELPQEEKRKDESSKEVQKKPLSHKAAIEMALKWAEKKVKTIKERQEAKKKGPDPSEQLGTARTEDSEFEDLAAQQVQVIAKEADINLTLMRALLKKRTDTAASLWDKLPKNPPKEPEIAVLPVLPPVPSSSSSWGVSSILNLFSSGNVGEIAHEKAQFSDPPSIPKEFVYEEIVGWTDTKKKRLELFTVQRWGAQLKVPEGMEGNDPNTLEGQWNRFDRNDKQKVFGLIENLLTALHYPCCFLLSDYNRFANMGPLNDHQKLFYWAELQNFKKMTITPLSAMKDQFQDHITQTITQLKALSENMKLSPQALVRPENPDDIPVYEATLKRIEKATEARQAILEIIAFLSTVYEEDKKNFSLVLHWIDSKNVFDYKLPSWLKQQQGAINTRESLATWQKKKQVAEPSWRNEEPPPAEVARASQIAHGYRPLKVTFTERGIFDPLIHEPLEDQFLRYIQGMKPAQFSDFLRSMEQREGHNLDIVWKCFLAQASELKETMNLFKGFLEDLLRLEWDAQKSVNLDWYDAAFTNQRNTDWYLLKARWDAAIAQRLAWESNYAATAKWLTVMIAQYNEIISKNNWYQSQTEVAFRSGKGVERFILHFHQTVSYFEYIKIQLDYIYGKQIVPTVTNIASHLNTLRRHHENAWRYTNQDVSNPFNLHPTVPKNEARDAIAR